MLSTYMNGLVFKVPMHCERRSRTVIAAEWMVALREARLGTKATMMLFVTGIRVLHRRGTMLLKA